MTEALKLAADPMRPVDIVGLFGVMVVGLLIVASHDAVARWLVRALRGSAARELWAGRAAEIVMTIVVLWLAGGAVVLSALAALRILEPRPGAYPGGIWTKVGAVLALVVLVLLAVRRLVHVLNRERA
jgi:hypothetical protein